MKYIRLFFIFLSLGLMLVAYQNFRSISPQLSEELKEEIQVDGKTSIKNVEKFYSGEERQYLRGQKKYYEDPKDYLEERLKDSPAYTRMKRWMDRRVEGPDRVVLKKDCKENCVKSYSEIAKDEEIDVRVNPLKAEASMHYEGEWNADLAYNQDESNMEVKVYRQFQGGKSSLEVQHESEGSETYINYLLNW